jgi:tetratricopeptide (TPR) repeat protein
MRTTAFLLAMCFWTASASSAQVNHAEELQRALQLYDSGNYAEALELYKKLIEVEPNHPTLLYEAGLTAKALGDLKACIAYATDAVATQRGLPSSLALLGSCQDDAGDSKAAVESFERALAIAPTDSQLNFNYALTLARLGKAAEAREHARISIESDPTRSSAYALYAVTLDAYKLDGAAALMRLRFIILEPKSQRASDAATAIAKRVTEYRNEGKTADRATDGVQPNSKSDLALAALNVALAFAIETEHKYVAADAPDAARFVAAMDNLLTGTIVTHERTSALGFVWNYAAAPLEDFTKVGLLQTFLYYVAGLAKLDGSREWLEAHPAELEVLERAFRATKGK